jgi:hypothetical protein
VVFFVADAQRIMQIAVMVVDPNRNRKNELPNGSAKNGSAVSKIVIKVAENVKT